MANDYVLEDLLHNSFGATQDPFTYFLSADSPEIDRSSRPESHLSSLHRRAGRLSDFIRVDGLLPGCPPPSRLLAEYLNRWRGAEQNLKIPKTVCADCNRKQSKLPAKDFTIYPREPDDLSCFSSRGTVCLGFLTRGGCGASCVDGGLPCWGCRGPSDTAFKKLDQGSSLDELFVDLMAKRSRAHESSIRPLIRVIRKRSNCLLAFYKNCVIDRSTIL